MSISGNLNYIRRAMRHGCASPNIEIIIETAFQAAVPNLFKLTLFGCTDIVKMKLGRSPWHTRALKGLIDSVHTPETRAGNRFLFHIGYDTIEKYLWWWMVADAATSFAADWMSLMYEEQRCQLPNSGHLTAPLTALYAGPESNIGTVFINGVDARPCCRIGGNSVVIPAGCVGSISYHCEWTPFLGLPANQGSVTTWLEGPDGKKYDETESKPDGFGGVHQTIGMAPERRATVTADEQWFIRYKVNQGLMGCQRGHVSVSAQGRHIPLIGAGCTPTSPEQVAKRAQWGEGPAP